VPVGIARSDGECIGTIRPAGPPAPSNPARAECQTIGKLLRLELQHSQASREERREERK